MPELAEVQTVSDTLKNLIQDRKIIDIDVLYPNIIVGDVEEFKKKMIGQHFRRFLRRGKYLLFEMDDLLFVSHLRMEGKYYYEDFDTKDNKHSHIIFYLDNGKKLAYNDTRKFGRMELLPKRDNYNEFKDLGPEPFSEDFNLDYCLNVLNNEKKSIKALLLDQHFVAGIGNIYADEIIFAIGIHPETAANLMDEETIEKMIVATRDILNEAIAMGGTTIRSYTSSLGVNGRFQQKLKVHQKEGECCPLCQTKILKTRVAGRGTYYCPHCQKKTLHIAVTGSIGSGKTTVMNYLKQHYNYNYFLADEEVALMYRNDEKLKTIIHKLYPAVFVNDEISHSLLAELIFNDSKAKKVIEELVFKRVLETYKKASMHADVMIAEMPLLFEAKLESYFEHILVISSSKKTAIERLKKKGLSQSDAIRRQKQQTSLKTKLDKADYHIVNNGNIEELYDKIEVWIDKYVR